jgi:hypothetical protein
MVELAEELRSGSGAEWDEVQGCGTGLLDRAAPSSRGS